MKPDCLNERDLILLHYGEAPEGMSSSAVAAHLAACPACRAGLEQLAADLARIPVIAEPDPAAVTRIVARVNERRERDPARNWLPLLGGATAATAALFIALVVQMPRQGVEPSGLPAAPSMVSLDIEEEMPDIDFLEDLELVEELELLRQIEGV